MTLIITTFAAFALISLIVHVTLLWIACRIVQSRVGFGKALLAVLLVALFETAFLSGGFYLLQSASIEVLALTMVVSILIVPVLAILIVLRLRLVKALFATLLWQVFGWLYVFIAAVGVRTFLFEAFVVPTGAMAETIQGYHKDITCPNCGFHFAINASQEADPQDRSSVVINGCTCPSCQQEIRLVDSRIGKPRNVNVGEFKEVVDPGISSPDRILVGKGFLAGSGFPLRFDLVTFKYPKDENMTYVKRVVGLPGETLAIHGGDLSSLKTDESEGETKATARFEKGEFTILRKSPEQILSVMRLVHDNDHQVGMDRWRSAGNGLRLSDVRKEFRSNPEAQLTYISYHHTLRSHEGKPTLITDFTGYNSGRSMQDGVPAWGHSVGANWVGDLILECQIEAEKKGGKCVLELTRGGEQFQASWDLASGKCELLRVRDGKPESLAAQPTKCSSGTHTLRFANVDQRLTVWVDEQLPFGDGIAYARPRGEPPTVLDLTPARIGAGGGYIGVSKIKLFRDLYITPGNGDPSRGDVHIEDLSNPRTWGDLRNLPVRTMYVQPGHYLCIGDNPSASSDSRSWGLIPERLLIGKVWLRYYPFSRAGGLR
jgi:signal peptidase I